MTSTSKTDTLGHDKDAVRAIMKRLLTGLSKRFSDPEDFLNDDFMATIKEVNRIILPNIKFEHTWTDHFLLINEIVKENNRQCILCKVEVEPLGNMGVLLSIISSEDHLTRKHTARSKYHPFSLLLAANVKYQFRDLSITLKPTRYIEGRAETEIMMQ